LGFTEQTHVKREHLVAARMVRTLLLRL